MFGHFNFGYAGGDPHWHEHGHHEHGHHHGPEHHHEHHHEHGFPWMRDHPWRGPMFRMRMGRGFFGRGGPFGPEGFFEGRGEGRRFFGRGDIKFALLELLQERPMHGYEMMKALEERSGGFYVASAGSIYPTLQMLEDRGLVTAAQVEGKKVYSITDAGRALLAERHKEEEEGSPWRHFGPGKHWHNPEMQALRSEAMEVTRLFVIAGRSSFRDAEKLGRLRSILEQTRKELSDLIYGETGGNTNSDDKTPPTTEQA